MAVVITEAIKRKVLIDIGKGIKPADIKRKYKLTNYAYNKCKAPVKVPQRVSSDSDDDSDSSDVKPKKHDSSDYDDDDDSGSDDGSSVVSVKPKKTMKKQYDSSNDESSDDDDSGASVEPKKTNKPKPSVSDTESISSASTISLAPDDTDKKRPVNERVRIASPELGDVDNSGLHEMLDPVNITQYVQRQDMAPAKPVKLPKSLLNFGIKQIQQPNKKPTKAQAVKQADNIPEEEVDIEKKKLLTKIRQYIFAFEDNKYINEYVGNNRDRFVLSLANKKVKELQNIFEYIQFHVRSKDGSDRMVENIIATSAVVIEKIGMFVGLKVNGLANEINHDLKEVDSDLRRAVTELSIEMDLSRYFNSPKVDILMIMSQKMLFTHQKNKLLQQIEVKNSMVAPPPPQSTEAILKSGLDDGLRDKYQDL